MDINRLIICVNTCYLFLFNYDVFNSLKLEIILSLQRQFLRNVFKSYYFTFNLLHWTRRKVFARYKKEFPFGNCCPVNMY